MVPAPSLAGFKKVCINPWKSWGLIVISLVGNSISHLLGDGLPSAVVDHCENRLLELGRPEVCSRKASLMFFLRTASQMAPVHLVMSSRHFRVVHVSPDT